MKQDITPSNDLIGELDVVTRIEHYDREGNKDHSVITHIERNALIKCQACNKAKRRKAFYICKSGKAAPYCIACNTNAVLKESYRRAIRTQGVKAFTAKLARKEYQVDLMLKALSEYQKQEGKK